ncbi:MAG: NRDE family protein [Steroidobacteraceae bacterium]|jgi:uncharacterized protein with NRDE domain
MCLLVLAWGAHPRYRLVVAANRDEYHERPAAALGKWPQPPGILAGRDLRAAGTWLALDPARRFGVVTNFRELQAPEPAAPSRGSLIPEYLAGAQDPREFFRRLEASAADYSGFNLLLADADSLWYGSNRAQPFARELPPGVYGLSNELLDTPWPKLVRVKARFKQWLEEPRATAAGLFTLLADRTQAVDGGAQLPRGGLPPDWDRILSAPFVVNPAYGTRCSTVVLLEDGGGVYLAERRFDSAGEQAGETEFRLNAGDWP